MRALRSLLILLLVFLASRALLHTLPGDPLETLLSETGTAVPRDLLRAQLGLDLPFWQSLFRDLKLALHGDLGRSILTQEAIAPQLPIRIGRTLTLTLASLAFGVTCAVVLGLTAAASKHSDSPWLRGAANLCQLGSAIASALPTVWLGPLLGLAFAIKLGWFSISRDWVLPALTLGISFSGSWSRLVRDRVSEILREPAAQAARARGVGELRTLLKYGLAPASPAFVAYLGSQAGSLMAGAFVTEVIFDWAGMGSFLVDAVLQRDYPVVQAAVFSAASFSILGTWLGDWLQHRIDPRLRVENS
jgi:peptide/nickel transport system permease protein